MASSGGTPGHAHPVPDPLRSVPAPWPQDLELPLRNAAAAARQTVIVFDDDPTGTQTAENAPVLTAWDVDALVDELRTNPPLLYLLTNTRAMPAGRARELVHRAAAAVAAAACIARRRFTVVSRGDSTLRGHFPVELHEIAAASDSPRAPRLLIPFFEAGGRVTINDTHFVRDRGELVPVADTPFAKDRVFGYRHSDLRQWIEEKTGVVRAEEVHSISLSDIRQGGPGQVEEKLSSLPEGSITVINAADRSDVEVVALAMLRCIASGSTFHCQAAASFVAALAGTRPPALYRPKKSSSPGLVVVGSHVARTSEQLQHLLSHLRVEPVPIAVDALVHGDREQEILRAAMAVDVAFARGLTPVLYTSRELLVAGPSSTDLTISESISFALCAVVRRLTVRPSWIVAKGGITSSDLATSALECRRAIVLGQVAPGVPIWRLGPECALPRLRYVVFPGNVGALSTLTDVVSVL